MSIGSTVYYDGYGSYDCPKNFFRMQPLKEVQNKKIKNSHLENLTTKKMSTVLSVYYDGYGSYDYPKNFLLIKPLKGVKKKLEKCSSGEFDNEENEHWTKFVLRRVR